MTTKINGTATFTFESARSVAVGQIVTATATAPHGNTSESSRPPFVAEPGSQG